jgi:hypothetical protein
MSGGVRCGWGFDVPRFALFVVYSFHTASSIMSSIMSLISPLVTREFFVNLFLSIFDIFARPSLSRYNIYKYPR